MSLLKEGEVIHNTYEVERFLGEGAFAEVYRVKHRFLGRQAMKVFKRTGMSIKDVEDMLSEAILLSRIGHPNIVRVFDANVTETSTGLIGFFTMEYVAGGTLDQFWRSHRRSLMPVETAVDILRQVCRGLVVAHRENPPIIHRDIKPQNILIGYDGHGLHARLSDFGLAKRVNPMTLMASSQGTRCFKAPEAFEDFHSDSRAGDVWALGSVLYLILTDQMPYRTQEDMEFIDGKCFTQKLTPPSQLNILVDSYLEGILVKALAIKPDLRHPSAKELLDDLENWGVNVVDAVVPPSSQKKKSAKDRQTTFSPAREEDARHLAEKAVQLVRSSGNLNDAADLLEEAINKWPKLRDEYEYKLRLWRRGVIA